MGSSLKRVVSKIFEVATYFTLDLKRIFVCFAKISQKL